MKKLIGLITLTLLILINSGCTKVQYMPCPVFEPKAEQAPLLDFKGTGNLYKLLRGDYFVRYRNGDKIRHNITDPRWVATDKTVKRVLKFEKECKQDSADFRSTVKGINIFNAENEDLETFFKVKKFW